MRTQCDQDNFHHIRKRYNAVDATSFALRKWFCNFEKYETCEYEMTRFEYIKNVIEMYLLEYFASTPVFLLLKKRSFIKNLQELQQ